MPSEKLKRCRYCKEKRHESEMVRVQLSWFCNYDHAAEFGKAKAKEKAEKQYRDKTKELKAKVRTRADAKKEAQAAFNAYIRERDDALPCISCGRHHQGQYHAGHFYTRKARPDIAFNTYNCHKQCSVCNNHLSGNLIGYRDRLVDKIGIERVEELKRERPYNSTIEYYDRLKAVFTKRKKHLKKLRKRLANKI